MATSYSLYKQDIKEYLEDNFSRKATILDVGAGSGTYYNLLHDIFDNIDAVEVFYPNVERYDLLDKYRHVTVGDIKDYEYDFYDIIIFGDVIEHLDVEDAQRVLTYALPRCKELIVAVPYLYPQDEVEGNIYEIHKQPDLTPAIMSERYPYLTLLVGDERYGYYIKSE